MTDLKNMNELRACYREVRVLRLTMSAIHLPASSHLRRTQTQLQRYA